MTTTDMPHHPGVAAAQAERAMLIAQISDLHVMPPGGLAYGFVDTAGLLRAAVAHLNRLVPAPDAVLITGDVAHPGDREAYVLARWMLAPLAMPYFVIPGNHDRRDELRAAFADRGYLP